MVRDKYDTSTLNFFDKIDISYLENQWFPPQEFPDLRKYDYVAVDVETRDPDLTTRGPGWATGNGELVGVAIAAGDFYGYYPIAHARGDNIDPRIVVSWLNETLSGPNPKIMHNAQYDLGWLWRAGINVNGPIYDTMIAAALVDENRFSYSLNNLGRDLINETKNEKFLRMAAADHGVDPKSGLWQLAPMHVGHYGEQDAILTLKLWNFLSMELQRQDLWSIFELETRVIRPVFEMRKRGVRIDLDRIEEIGKKLNGNAEDALLLIKKESGLDVDPWSNLSVQALFDKLGLPYGHTDQGAPSFTKGFLKSHEHPAVVALVRLREMDKAAGTFLESFKKFEHDGRIHAEFHQLRSDDGGTVTGRFSSSSPNLQQVPARNPEIGNLIRSVFLPEEGQTWYALDYSSQEPRILTHFAASMPDRQRHNSVDELVKKYHSPESADLHQVVADIVGIPRKQAKAINLGIMYGMGKAKMANELGVSVDEAEVFIDKHHRSVPFVKGLATTASDIAGKRGQIRTILGRLCHFNLWEPRSFEYHKALPLEEAEKEYGTVGRGLRRAFTYKALNKLIQGSAADQNKLALAQCYDNGMVPLLTVHDELDFSFSSHEEALEAANIMETGVEMKVPSRVDIEYGPSWGEAVTELDH